MSKENNFITSPSLFEKITGGITLIFIGIILLLNSTGVLDWSVWGTFFMIFIRFWPLFLVGVGLQIIFSKSNIAKIVLNLLWTLFILTVFTLAALSTSKVIVLPDNLTSWNWVIFNNSKPNVEKETAVPKDENPIEELIFNFNMSAGKFNLKSQNDSNNYLELKSKYYSDHGEPEIVTETLDNKKSEIRFNQKLDNFFNGSFKSGLEYNMQMDSNNISSDVIFSLSAGELNADLGDLSLNSMKLSISAGNADIKLGNNVKKLNLYVTAGDLKLSIPNEYKLSILSESTAGKVVVDDIEISDGATTINEEGTSTLQISINQTAGNIEIARF